MTKIAKERAENVFTDFKAAYTPQQALVEANRCLFCADAPCIQACPTGIEIPQFIRKIATGNVKGSARTIFDSNILGMSCARVCPVEVLCVGKCVYNEMGVPPIQIGKLQRYSTDHAFAEGWRFFEAAPDSGKSVGLVGAGPASLAAAHELRRHGHACTIYDKRDVTGGLNTTGVAPYKMKADRSEDEVEWVLGIGGIEVRTGVEVGRDVTWGELLQAHDALFVGVGLGPDTRLDVPGADLSGIHGAVEAIERVKLGTVDLSGVEHAVVVGGGNTAIDAVRELRGLGVADVTMLYRGTEPGMSGYAHEWSAAKDEGVRARWQTQPVAFEGQGRVQSIRCVRLDQAKQPIAGSEHEVPAELVLLAIGQSKLEALLLGLGVTFERGRVVVDEHQATARPGVYAGGDCANGGKEVVNAAAEGKRAALAIHEYIVRVT
ncbi:NAD(P)-dependent oxidoreductase [Paraliomyxa miuraensis]|uniref:NAD(P)-dependent oxidoreductase n=1 Tax=Paraliomyxa miuraensis TaxID=376150 RepID=UPI002250F5C9|nr:NAD(P)-dependent oxidoreductase [Paraliomyxa miuraensis]MCX4242922.1 NAD(P)-dependent oxidoreductase [Paraliomyxa miuraensis]